jgi:hypothetical protein
MADSLIAPSARCRYYRTNIRQSDYSRRNAVVNPIRLNVGILRNGAGSLAKRGGQLHAGPGAQSGQAFFIHGKEER